MFTGIVQHLSSISSISTDGELRRFQIQLDDLTKDLQRGASVAVNGTCLTVTSVTEAHATFDAIPETLRTTNLGKLTEGSMVNLERSFQFGDEVGGHILSGHITTTASVADIYLNGHDRVITFAIAPEWLKFIFHKGYIGLDGASITVSAVDRDRNQFAVSLIPETIERTTLGHLVKGDGVNIEVDSQTQTIVETVERILAEPEMRQQLLQKTGAA